MRTETIVAIVLLIPCAAFIAYIVIASMTKTDLPEWLHETPLTTFKRIAKKIKAKKDNHNENR